jgi:hypothetical protein
MATTAQAAQAPLTLKRSGFWETYYAVASDGNHLCGMQVTGNNASLMVKYIPGRTMSIQIFKTGWRIPLPRPPSKQQEGCRKIFSSDCQPPGS